MNIKIKYTNQIIKKYGEIYLNIGINRSYIFKISFFDQHIEVSVTLTLTLKVSGGGKYISLKGAAVNIKIKYTNQITKKYG